MKLSPLELAAVIGGQAQRGCDELRAVIAHVKDVLDQRTPGQLRSQQLIQLGTQRHDAEVELKQRCPQ
jgi:hypothetical protein